MRTKVCRICGVEKEICEFYTHKEHADGLYNECKECIRSRSRLYNLNHKVEISVYRKGYYKRNKLSEMEYAKEYRKTEVGKEAVRKGVHKYRKTEKGISTYNKAIAKYNKTPKGKDMKQKKDNKRRAFKKGVIYQIFNPSYIFERDDYICQNCGRKTRPDFNDCNNPLYPNLDHIVPLSKGGAHTKENTQCLCHQCNTWKSNIGVGDQLRLFG